MSRILLSLLAVAALATLSFAAAPAEAADQACFDWDCDSSTYKCTFDAGCSSFSGSLWRYRWDFGDGSGYVLTGNEVIEHTYSSSEPHPDVNLTVVTYTDPAFGVTCEILVYGQVGPPQPTYGTCP